MVDMKHMEFLETVAEADVAHVRSKEATYQGSWKKRGGVGVYMMLARKWDRIENTVEQARDTTEGGVSGTGGHAPAFDLLQHLRLGQHPDGLLDDVRDLRTYLLLVEAELLAQGVVRSDDT